MSKSVDTPYYAARAREERRMIEAAIHPRAAAVHAELAARYEALSSDPSFALPTMESPRLEASG